MEGLLAPITTTVKSDVVQQENLLVPVRTEPSHGGKQISSLNGPEDILEILKSKPDHEELSRVLRWLKSTADAREGFNINIPGPKAAQVVYVLVNDIIPDYWATLSGKRTNKSTGERLLIRCLSSVTGIGAIVARLRQLLDRLRTPLGQAEISGSNKFQPLEILLDVLEAVLDSDAFVASVWNDIDSYISQSSLKSLQWKEFVSLVASGKVLSIASEANLALDAVSESVANGSWVGNGFDYATWLGRNVKHTINTLPKNKIASDKALSQLLRKALNLGYTGQFRGETVVVCESSYLSNRSYRSSSFFGSIERH
jgi:telomere length regulation protein